MSLSILAVDDSRTIRDMLTLALTQAGFEPKVAEDGVHGLEVLEGMQPDAIITDINMPRLDGFGFIEAVRERDIHRTTPILVLTTESAPELKARARAAGATGWIVKPFDPNKLVKALNMVAGTGTA
ncbi:MAG: response regulator [Pseudomonadota bacterium]